ncbi:MAG: hypothetical protein ABMB14_23400 [Myxococcota bacterium]
MLAFLLACRNPALVAIDEVAVPTSVEAPQAHGPQVRIGVTAAGVFLDPTPWDPDAAPVRVMGLDAPQDHELGLPALVAALEPVREARQIDGFAPEVRIDGSLPYEVAVRVLFSLSMAGSDGAWIGIRGGALRLLPPSFCGIAPPGRACVQASVDEAPDGLVVTLDPAPAEPEGCIALPARVGPPTAPRDPADWRGRFLAGPTGGCPTVPHGGDLLAALGRARAYGPPCAAATLTARDDTPWSEVVARWVAMRASRPNTQFAIHVDDAPACSDPIAP